MKRTALVFTGTRYRTVHVQQLSGFGIHKIEAGRPLRYEANGPEAWWRDLAELDFNSADAISRFVNRRGDPSDTLEREGISNSTRFHLLASGLREVAEAWDAPGEDGLSHAGDPSRIEAAMRRLSALASELPSPDGRNVVVPDNGLIGFDVILSGAPPLGLSIRARTLAAYLYASASHCLTERIAMRRCNHCLCWFDASSRRAGARFCSASCRTLFYKPTAAKQPQQEDV